MYCEDTRNVIDEFKNMPTEEIKRRKKLNAFSAAFINIEKNINIGTALRSFELFAGREFIITGKRSFDRRGCVGAQNYTNLLFLPDIKSLIDWCEKEKRTPICIDKRTGSSIPTRLIEEYPKNPLFIFGSESSGIPDELWSYAHLKLHIHQYGVMRSLNLAVAASIIFNDWCEKHLPVKDLLAPLYGKVK